MFKILTLATSLTILLFGFTAQADTSMLSHTMKTKDLVRMKLWYEGAVDTQKLEEISKTTKPPMSPELIKALSNPML